jgi:CBS domain-containing protein
VAEASTSDPVGQDQLRAFTRALLDDVRALERMLDEGLIESDVRRVGAEQELFLVDGGGEPAPVAEDVLRRLAGGPFTTELARFNLEANLPPYTFGGTCLREMEAEIERLVRQAQGAAAESSADVLLAGILPTLRLNDLTLHNMMPLSRYRMLNEGLMRTRGGDIHIRIKGIDEFYATHDNVMAEACNTSFQVHFQVGGEEFANLYNLAQAVTAPVLAAAVNSPLFAEHRLWHETRVALLQHSIDDRSHALLERGQRPRVRFGDKWVERSALEIFRDDIARFRIMLAGDVGASSLDLLERGEIPPLRALCLHNGTVYRWNRPCYGLTDGKPHLRIENRVLPAGPTIVDQVANAAFFYGLLAALSDEYGDITQVMSFDTAMANFVAAARHGLHAQFTWLKGGFHTASQLILDHLLPLAREGLKAHAIESSDIDRYLGVVEERVRRGRTGAQWTLDSLAAMRDHGTAHVRCRALVAASLAHQKEGTPVHAWPPATLEDAPDWRHSFRTVGQFMTRDLFTVQPDDLVDLAANLMDWEHIRHIPVEDEQGRLVGLLAHRRLLRHLARRAAGKDPDAVAVSTIMRTDPVYVAPETSTLDAIALMRKNKVGCLPVVSDDKLVGIITEADLIVVSARLLEQHLRSLE